MDAPLPRSGSRREVLAWGMYDWASSAYSVLSITVLAFYLQAIAFPREEWGVAGAIVWAWGITLSMLAAAVLSPLCGAMADARANKRTWLAATAGAGSVGAIVLGLIPHQWPWTVAAVFVLTAFFLNCRWRSTTVFCRKSRTNKRSIASPRSVSLWATSAEVWCSAERCS